MGKKGERGKGEKGGREGGEGGGGREGEREEGEKGKRKEGAGQWVVLVQSGIVHKVLQLRQGCCRDREWQRDEK